MRSTRACNCAQVADHSRRRPTILTPSEHARDLDGRPRVAAGRRNFKVIKSFSQHIFLRPGDTSFASTGTHYVEPAGRLLVSSSYRWAEDEGPGSSGYVSRVDEFRALNTDRAPRARYNAVTAADGLLQVEPAPYGGLAVRRSLPAGRLNSVLDCSRRKLGGPTTD